MQFNTIFYYLVVAYFLGHYVRAHRENLENFSELI